MDIRHDEDADQDDFMPQEYLGPVPPHVMFPTWTTVSFNSITALVSDEELVERDRRARENYDIIMFMVKKGAMYKPSIDTLYYHQAEAVMTNIPHDLQLDVLFRDYENIARSGFVAKKTGQNPVVTDLIWLYGIDANHSLNRYHAQTRCNIIPMAYVLACGFPEHLCPPGAVEMIESYIDVWMNFIVEYETTEESEWSYQRNCLEAWRESEYDLMLLTQGQAGLIDRLIKNLVDRKFLQRLRDLAEKKAKEIVVMRRAGQISDEEWKVYGAKLAIAWTLATNAEASAEKIAADKLKQQREDTNTAAAKAKAECRASDLGTHVLRQVPWYTPILRGLLRHIDPAFKDPNQHMKATKHDRPQGKPWMTVEAFIDLLKTAAFENDMDGLVGSLESMAVRDHQQTKVAPDVEMGDV